MRAVRGQTFRTVRANPTLRISPASRTPALYFLFLDLSLWGTKMESTLRGR